MAKDDMDVIIYKILRYMYECMKQGRKPMLEDICHDCMLFKIPKSYWDNIIVELINAGYVRGFMHRDSKDGLVITMTDSAAITLDGVHFLEENNRMAKAKQFLGTGFEIALGAVLTV